MHMEKMKQIRIKLHLGVINTHIPQCSELITDYGTMINTLHTYTHKEILTYIPKYKYISKKE